MGRPAHSKRGSKVQVALYLTPEEIDYLVSRAPGGTTPSRALHSLLKDAMRGTTPGARPHLSLPTPAIVRQSQPEPSQPVVQAKEQTAQAKGIYCAHCIRKQNWTDVNCPHCKTLRERRR